MPASMEALAAAEPDLRADAMLWPHHGHDPDAVGTFAERLGAKVLVASDARPLAPQPAPPWARARGVAIYHTGTDGAVTLDLTPEAVRVETFCPRADAADAQVEADGEPAD
jgi:beta-lactamase superfamily II metal-dependent hydrolase